jgi:hypothetical protein
MDFKDIRVAWRSRSLLKQGETTDLEGYAPREFSFTDGNRFIEMVRNDNLESSCYQKELFKTPQCLIDVQLWHTKDKKHVYVVARINQYQSPVLVP